VLVCLVLRLCFLRQCWLDLSYVCNLTQGHNEANDSANAYLFHAACLFNVQKVPHLLCNRESSGRPATCCAAISIAQSKRSLLSPWP
jgi:hypothetical protein